MDKDISCFEVNEWVVTAKYIRKNRWFVKLENNSITRTMPHANYTWLKGNPSFKGIPRGYVIHHLDHDELNDDISNLALMYKHHHTAHHIKNIPVLIVPIEVYQEKFSEPIREPKVMFLKKREHWVIRYWTLDNGKKIEKFVYNVDGYGKHFKTEQEALSAIANIWPDKPWEQNGSDTF